MLSVAALLWLFWGWQNLGLLWIGAISAAAFIGQAAVRQLWRKQRTAAQVVGSAGLTSTAAAAFYVVTHRFDATAWSLWTLNLLFAVNQIQFVQLRIRAAQAKTPAQRFGCGRAFFWSQILTAGILIAGSAAHLLHWYMAAAFVPILWRGFAWYLSPFRSLAVHSLGKRELAYAITFGVLLVFAACFA
jgi:hypothetical protein